MRRCVTSDLGRCFVHSSMAGDKVIHVELAADAFAEIARVFDEVFAAYETPEVFPLFGAARSGQHYVAVFRLQRQLGAEHIAALAARYLAGGLVEGHGAGHVGHHAVVHRHVYVLALPGAVAAFQGHHYRQRRPDAGNRVADVVAHHLRAALRGAGDRHPAAHALDAGVVGGPVGVWPRRRAVGVAVAGEAGVDEARVDFVQPVVSPSPGAAMRPAPSCPAARPTRPPMRSNACLQRGSRRSMVTTFLVAVQAQVAGAYPLPLGAVYERAVARARRSPAPGRSILMTSAPMSASIMEQKGPATMCVTSSTRRPSSGRGMLASGRSP